ncbi:MAG: carboxypeptidase regulatory-like domain-containing protein [Deltaproteobacteria bacterium]|nr:carboxypeptidase regulatory-like domain-containing protein [Deltaproteobacteria bacterium]
MKHRSLLRHCTRLGTFYAVFLLGLLSAAPVRAMDLGEAQLLIAGARLAVAPEQQTVPYDTPSVIFTELQGYDADNGVLPQDLKVVGDFSGPEIDGVLVLETTPNEPFRLPRLTLKGQYSLDNIRLVQGGELLAFAEPRTAGVLVTQILITRVTSRPLTLEEIRARGIIIDEDNFQAFNFVFGFAVDTGEVREMSFNLAIPRGGGGTGRGARFIIPGGPRFPQIETFDPPKIIPTVLETGGCSGGCSQAELPPIPAAIVFPFDNAVLNQFFSVMLMAQNGAPEGDALVLRDLSANLRVPAGLRPAETEPPTPLGVPVPVRVPGPDGELGTGDDDPDINGQETGQAEFLVEGLREGNHIVSLDIEGILQGLPTGLQPVSGVARGVVLVRDPTFGVVLSHPASVQANQEYSLRLSLTNTSNAPANLVTVRLPVSGVAGAEVIGTNERVIETLLPTQTEVLQFRVRSRVSGRVVSTALRTGDNVSGRIELTTAVGDVTTPPTPNSIVLPAEASNLPDDLVDSLFRFASQAFTVATTPKAALEVDLPKVSRAAVTSRVNQLAMAGRYNGLGEDLFDGVAMLAAEWTGGRDARFDWDDLRRATFEGASAGAALGGILASEAQATSAEMAFDRFISSTADLPAMAAVLGVGSGLELEVASRVSGQVLFGSGVRNDRRRELPFADLFDLGDAEMALLAAPEPDGYQVRFRQLQAGSTELHLLVPTATGELRMARWRQVPSLGAAGLAVVDFLPGASELTLMLDVEGDGVVDHQIPATFGQVTRRPFEVVAALQNADVDETGHVVEVLFSRELDLDPLVPPNPSRFQIAGKLSNGGLSPQEAVSMNGSAPSRVLRVVFDNPLSPFNQQQMTVRDITSLSGAHLSQQVVTLTSNLTTPGITVTGTVVGPDGEPVANAPVELFEYDVSPFTIGPDACVRHRTAAVISDANGQYTFDYVRQTLCGGDFQLQATDPERAHRGRVRDRVRTSGETVRIDIVMLGRGVVRGQVLFEDGSVPTGANVTAYSSTFGIGKRDIVDDNGNFDIRDVPVGTITVLAEANDGNFVTATVEVERAGAVVERNLTILRRPDEPVGGLRGQVLDASGTEPVFRAFITVFGEGGIFLGQRFTDEDGRFSFDVLPTIPVLITAFSSETGRFGSQATADIPADGVAEVTMRLLDERASVEGHVYIQTPGGLEPAPMAIVWADGTAVNTVTDANGFYRLDGIPLGTFKISAIDQGLTLRTDRLTTFTFDGEVVNRDLTFNPPAEGGIAGEVLDYDGNPVVGATVHVAASFSTWFGEAFTDSSGQFLLEDIPKGRYEVHATKGDDGGIGIADILASGQTAFTNIRFKKGTIRGQVLARQESGELAGVRSFISYNVPSVKFGLVRPFDTLTLETEDDGTFEISDVLVGNYALTARNPFYGNKTQSGHLAVNGELAEHDFIFELNGTIRGVIYDIDGETPVEGATVNLRHPNFSNFEVTSDENGEFRFELVPPPTGRASLSIEAFWDAGMFFRVGQVRISGFRQGQTLETELVLEKKGLVTGWVENTLGDRLAGLTVTLQEVDYPRRRLQQVTDAEGNYSFSNIFEGPVVVSTITPNRQAGGKTFAELRDEGMELNLRIRVDVGINQVQGRVLSPVDGSPVSGAQVNLRGENGRDAAVSDAEGGFLFDPVRFGTYSLTAFDAGSGRAGRLLELEVSPFTGDRLGLELVLEARGSVQGTFTDPVTQSPVAGETIRLTTSPTFVRTYSSSDSEGVFLFDGIPEGDFFLFAQETGGRRKARASGQISGEDEVVDVDLVWEPSGAVVGRVLAPGDGEELFAPDTLVTLSESFSFIDGTNDNPYRFEGVIANRSIGISAQEELGNHRGSTFTRKTESDEDQVVDVRMRPLGSVTVIAEDSFGNRVPSAEIRLNTNGFYRQGSFFGMTNAQGEISFANVGEARLYATATDPVTGLRGGERGDLEVDGELVTLTVILQDSGGVVGSVLLADGVTPASNALLSLQFRENQRDRELILFTEPDGSYDFPAVPLVSFSLVVLEDGGPGQQRMAGRLTSNGQVIDFGTVVLDEIDPEVSDVFPAANQVGLPVDAQPSIKFSEPIDLEEFNGSWIDFRKTGSGFTSHSRQWSEGNTRLTLIPSDPLESFTNYQLRIDDAIRDEAGRDLGVSARITFTTADVLPPEVVFTFPEDGDINLPVDTLLRVVFSEPMNADSLAAAFQFENTDTGAPVAFDFELLGDQREVELFPIEVLDQETLYRLTIDGAADVGGNFLAPPVVVEFRTLDVTAPEILTFSPAPGTVFTAGDLVPIRVVAQDNVGVEEVRFTFGDRFNTDRTVPFLWTVNAPAVPAAQNVEIVVEVLDNAGNSTTHTWNVLVEPLFDPNQPRISMLCPSDRVLMAPGTGIDLDLEVSDDQAVEAVDFYLGEATEPFETIPNPLDSFSYRFELPNTFLDGQEAVLRIVVRDFAGSTAEVQTTVQAVEGEIFDSNFFLSQDDFTYEGENIIITGGTFTIDLFHQFNNLVVMGGATLTVRDNSINHFANNGFDWKMALGLTGDLYVACGGQVHADRRGYDFRYTYFWEQLPNQSNPSPGGSHGGRGEFDSFGFTYGSLFDPVDLGAGGVGTGGGVIRIAAPEGNLIVDGRLTSNSETVGAGGSVRLEAQSIRGAGVIQASARDFTGTTSRGGGGRIALYTDMVAPDLWPRIQAGGGSAGTIFWKGSDHQFGELLVDGAGYFPTEVTELVSVGRGTVDSVTAATVTDGSASFGHTLQGVEVAFEDDFSELWTITSNDHRGQVLTVDAATQPLTAVAGDTYQGVYRFDRVTVRDGARLLTQDRILSGEAPEVEEGSLLVDGTTAAALEAAIQFEPGSSVASGESATIIFSAIGLVGIDRLELELSGVLTDSQTVGFAGEESVSHSRQYVPELQPGLDSVTVVLRAFDTGGAMVEVQRILTVVEDQVPPVVTITTPAELQAFTSGDTITVRFFATDNVALGTVYTAELGGFSVTRSSTSSTFRLAAPPVEEPRVLAITASAVDINGNVGTARRLIRVNPLSTDTQGPEMTVNCPGPNPRVIAGQLLPLNITVTDDINTFSVEAFLDDGFLPEARNFPLSRNRTFDLEIPIGEDWLEGEAHTLTLLATDYGANVDQVVIPLAVRDGVLITEDTTLAVGDLSLEGQSLLVDGATLTVEGPHSFERLIVVSGNVVHPPTDATTEQSLELTLDGELYIACGAGINVSGLGYLGGINPEGAYTYPNTQSGAASANPFTGGSHGGRGGLGGPALYGNLFDPREPGGGGSFRSGTSSSNSRGGNGGGVVRISTAGEAIIDGALSASGVDSCNGGAGAGGSIRLDASSLTGIGTIAATGGTSCGGLSSGGGSGGGGRVAVYSGTVDEDFVARVSAAAGSGPSFTNRRGAAGTVFIKRDTQAFGDLILDNNDIASISPTVVPTVGSGIVDAVAVDSMTDLDASFRHSLVGSEVAFNFDYSDLWRISSHAHEGDTLTLDTSSLPLSAQVGDAYRGVLRFDGVSVRGLARAQTEDHVITTEAPVVAEGSAWTPGNARAPVVDGSKIDFAVGLFGLSLDGQPGAVDDIDLPLTVEISNLSSNQNFTVLAEVDGSFSVPALGAEGDLLELTVRDSGFPNLTSVAQSFGPIGGDLGLSPELPRSDHFFESIAVDEGMIAMCQCFDNSEIQVPFELLLVDTSDPLEPNVAAVVDLGGGGGGDDEESCFIGCNLCYEGCSIFGEGDPICFDACDECFTTCADTDDCTQSCDSCVNHCTDNGGGPDCFAACDECAGTCSSGPPPPPPFSMPRISGSISYMALEDGVLAMAQGKYLRILDARDPENLFHDPATMDLELLAGTFDRFGGLALVDGILHAVERSGSHRYFAFDLHDPRNPRLLSQEPLSIRDPFRLEVREGEMHLASDRNGTGGAYQMFAIGDPANPILRATNQADGTAFRAGSLTLVDDVAFFNEWITTKLHSLHRGQPDTETSNSTDLAAFKSGFSSLGPVVEVGSKALIGNSSDADVFVGSFDTDFLTHGFQFETLTRAPVQGSARTLFVADRLLWVLGSSFGSPYQGFQSSALRPWLVESQIEAIPTASGAAVIGAPGAASGADFLTASVDGSTLQTAVAADGSFTLDLPTVEVGEALTLQALDGAGAGNKVRTRVAAGLGSTSLDLPGGAARIALEGTLAALLPVRQEVGLVAIPIVDTATSPPTLLSTVEVTGPVQGAVLNGGVLYVAAGQLEVFDLSAPGTPVAAPSLDPFTGQPVLDVALANGQLLALGDAGANLDLKTLDLAVPLAPVEVPSQGVAVSPVSTPRLLVEGTALWVFGGGGASSFLLAPGLAPALVASGSFPGAELVDLDVAGLQVTAAVAGEGVREIFTLGGAHSLGTAPGEAHHAFGVFRLSSVSGPRLWWAESLGGAKTLLRVDNHPGGATQAVYGHFTSRCGLRDAVTSGSTLILLTDCGIDRVELVP